MHNITGTLILTTLKAVLFLLLCVSSAFADISWMKAATNCRLFEPALSAYLDRIDMERYDSLPFWQREELSIVLKEACSGKFADCNLEACKRWGTLASVAQSTIGPQSGLPSMAWLDRFLTCEQLIEQIQGRYASLSSEEIASPLVKKELGYVLDVSCGARFQHCKFRSCSERNNQQAKGEISQIPVLEKTITPNQGKNDKEKGEKEVETDVTLELAKRKLANLVSDYRALRVVKIKAEMNVEKSEGRKWIRLANPYEAKVIAERREAIKERKKSYQEELAEEEELKNSKYKGYRAPRGTPTPSVSRPRGYRPPKSGALPF